jgi:nitroreductase
MTDRTAPTAHPIHALMAARWSPRSFTDAPVTAAEAASLLEAGRWAASCVNDQPWYFLVARRDADAAGFAALLGLLTPNNQGWAGRAGLLMITVARLRFAANGNPNAVALYDLGQAAAQISLQATAMGLQAHQMRGFDVERARVELGVPADHDPVSAIAIGHVGAPSLLPEALAAREVAPRSRKAIGEFAYAAGWSKPLGL